jgi:hypothetical protein
MAALEEFKRDREEKEANEKYDSLLISFELLF